MMSLGEFSRKGGLAEGEKKRPREKER